MATEAGGEMDHQIDMYKKTIESLECVINEKNTHIDNLHASKRAVVLERDDFAQKADQRQLQIERLISENSLLRANQEICLKRSAALALRILNLQDTLDQFGKRADGAGNSAVADHRIATLKSNLADTTHRYRLFQDDLLGCTERHAQRERNEQA
ncbi:hypothetical protein [Pseudomonas viridiflava]|uniref:hypothetical protein n=1 Tax=Pseudomonas viridiflava TaxID=33069 RepID=UPI000F034B8A|nr:hypothetical protein [Pseudomonas viridiflava]MEE4140290.1 hypothetical protein [Pseudomonas viridiflava]